MELLIFGLLALLVVAGFAVTLMVLVRKLRGLEQDKGAAAMLKTDLVELNRSLVTMQQHMGDKLDNGTLRMQQSMQRQLSESAKLM